jgi:hypothetical protein
MSDGRETAKTPPDVGAILAALRDEVRARRLAQGRAEPGPAERELQRALDEIELHRVVSAHWPLIGTTLPQRVVALLNKLVRRYLRWYINPIVEQQNAYNDAVARTLRLLAEAYTELAGQTSDHRRPTTDDWPSTQNHRTTEPQNSAPDSAVASDGPTTDDRPPTTDHRRPGSDKSTTDHGSQNHGQLMALVRSQAAIEPPACLPDLELYAVAPQLRLREQVSAHWPLIGATLPQRLVALLNKLVRRYLRWYINPIVEQQNAANAAVTVALMRLIALDAERRAEAAALRARERVKG